MKGELPAQLSLGVLYDLCGTFFSLIGGHYEENCDRYSPDYPRVFATKDLAEYCRVIVQHSNSGGAMARGFIRQEVGQLPPNGSIEDRMVKVFDSGDPCSGVESMATEGIETHFVIPAAIWVAMQAVDLSPSSALRHVVEQAIAIGGDPDTVGSIAMGIVGTHFGASLSSEIDTVLETIDLDALFIPRFLFEEVG